MRKYINSREALMDVIQKQWFDKANTYEPKEGRAYAWVLEYAKFRLNFTFRNGRYIEEKALAVFKLVLGLAVGTWAVFTLLLSQGFIFTWPVKMGVVGGMVSLMISGLYTLRAFGPTKRLLPLTEDAALDAIDDADTPEGAMATFSLAMASSTEKQSEITNRKGQLLRVGLRFTYAAILFLSLLLFLVVILQRFPVADVAAYKQAASVVGALA